MKIKLTKVQFFSLGSIVFKNEEKEESMEINYKNSYDFLKESKEIDGLELFELDINSISTGELCINKNKMEIFFKLDIIKMNNFQNNFKDICKEFNPENKKISKINDASMTINFNIPDIEFMFYQGDFHSIINNGEPVLYIYLKKFYYECLIKRKKNEQDNEIIFPIFPILNLDNQIDNLKIHDIVVQIKLQTKDLFDLIIKYEQKFKIVNNTVIKNVNQNHFDEDFETNFSLDTNNHDVIWLLLSLVSEKFITYYTLLHLINEYKVEIEKIINEDFFLFIISLKEILKLRFTLNNNKIKFFNHHLLFNYLSTFPKELNEEQKKDYDFIKSIYTENKIKEKYFKYKWIITPLTCYFKIPFLKTGIYLIDKYPDIKSYDLIYINFKNYKKINKIREKNYRLKVDADVYDYYKYNIITKNQSFGELSYEYSGATVDDIKYQKCWFINSNKLDIIKNIKKFLEIDTEKQHLYIDELLYNTDEAAYLCPYKSIKRKKEHSSYENEKSSDNYYSLNPTSSSKNSISSILNNCGIISETLSTIIQKECGIHYFTSVFGVLNGFIGNFSLIDSNYLNAKKRLIIRQNRIIQQKEKVIKKDNKFYILKIFKYKKGFIDNESINILSFIIKGENKSFINECIKNCLNLNINNIYNKVTIKKLKNFLEKIRENEGNVKGHKLLANNLLFDIKKELNEYQYHLLLDNKLEIPDSAILGGIIDECDIMGHFPEKFKNYIIVILDNEKYKNECIKGTGIIFKTRTNYINLRNNICQVKFFDIEKYENKNKDNISVIEKIRKVKKLKNIIIFPKNSLELFNDLLVEDISQQEFFISWNKDIYIKSIKILHGKREKEEDNSNEESVSYNELKKGFINNKYIDYIRQKGIIPYLHNQSNKNYLNNLKKFSPKISKYLKIDYKNLTKTLKSGQKNNLNELELFYLEYIPKCTKAIITIINNFKKLMYKYSSKNFAQLLIGNINIDINSKKYIEEIEIINDRIKDFFNEFLNLINSFQCLKYQSLNYSEYLSKYYERMFIISTIVYNICYYPEFIEEIIKKYKKNIKQFLNKKLKTDGEKLREKSINIEIKDSFNNEINELGVDYYLLFQNDILIDKYRKDNDFKYKNDFDNKNKIIESKYEKFFEDFKLILDNKNEIKNYYIPELLLFKYLSKLII